MPNDDPLEQKSRIFAAFIEGRLATHPFTPTRGADSLCDASWTLDHDHRAVLNTFLRRLERDKPSCAAEEAHTGSHDRLAIGRQLLDKGSAKGVREPFREFIAAMPDAALLQRLHSQHELGVS